MFQLLLCSMGRHRHMRRRTKRDASGAIASECRGCGIAMRRDPRSGHWHAGEPAEAAASAIPDERATGGNDTPATDHRPH